MRKLTPEQIQAAKEMAAVIRSEFKHLQEGEILARIMLVSGKGIKSALAGYEVMIELGLLNDFVDKLGFGFYRTWTKRNPTIVELFDRLDMLPGKLSKAEFEAFQAPPKADLDALRSRLSLGDLDF